MKDILGATISGLCIIHCMLTPVLLIMGISMAGLSFLESEWVHQLLAVPMVLLLVWSISHGWRIHRQRQPVLFGLAGLLLLIASLSTTDVLETCLAVSAGLILILAHLLNRKLIRNGAMQCA
ncbi:MAG: MerC domain-containing protein [Gammaproteobacteria bacterium]|nr:MerC domain-containing protein [Gammaproteobacteria bacterium]